MEPETATAVTAFAAPSVVTDKVSCGCRCCRERLVVGEDNLGAVGVGGGRGEGWWSASNCGVVGDRGAIQ